MNASMAILLSYFPIYLQSLGTNKVAIGMLMAGGPLISILANPFWAYWSDRSQNIRLVLIIMLIGNLIVINLVFQLEQYIWIYAGMLFFFLFQTPLFSQSNSLILSAIDGTPYKFGAFRIWGSIGWAVTAVAAAPMIQWMDIGNLWIIYSVMMVVTISLGFKLPRGGESSLAGFKPDLREMFRNRSFIVFLILGILISILIAFCKPA